jgi:hypothetical protein
MNSTQQTTYEAALRAKKFNEENATALSVIPDYDIFSNELVVNLAFVEDCMHQQAEDITVIAPDKAEHKIAMGEKVIKYAMRGATKAHQLGNLQLEAGLSHAVSYIIFAGDDLAESRAFDMKELMKNNLSILTNLEDANIEEMEEAITQFKTLKPLPKEGIEKKKSKGTDPLPGWLTKLDDDMTQMGKLIHSYLPDLAPTWDNYVKKGEPKGKRKLSVVVRYKDNNTGVNLRKVKVTFQKGDLVVEKKSTRLGYARMYGAEEGNWKITAEYAGYETDVKTDVGISENKIVRMEVKLKLLNS